MLLTSPVLSPYDFIPERYTSDGRNVNPPLHPTEIPSGTGSLVLFVDDPDSRAKPWCHWVVYNIPPGAAISEGDVPGTQAVNDFERHAYTGPSPHWGIHRYVFSAYALDCRLQLGGGKGRDDVWAAMRTHILAHAELVGLYEGMKEGLWIELDAHDYSHA